MIIQIHPEITSLANQFRGFLLDAYGVFWGGSGVGLYRGAKEVLEEMVRRGRVVGILSNSTQLVAKEMDKYGKHGLVQGRHFHFLVTSGEVARSIFLQKRLPFETPRNRYWVLGESHPLAAHVAIFKETPYVETSDIDEADFIYIAVPHIGGHDQVDPQLFRPMIAKIKSKNLPMVCANPDRFAEEGSPVKMVVRQGSLARLYEEMGGEVFYIGKPEAKGYEVAMQNFQAYGLSALADIVMVGDTPETDIRGARRFKISSALVTKTGIMGKRADQMGLKESLQALASHDVPDFLLERLADDIRFTS
jgi:HAD superfamily hydrolase (TIGR01459 family)